MGDDKEKTTIRYRFFESGAEWAMMSDGSRKILCEISYRFSESGAEWAMMADGHYKILRCGDLVGGQDPPMRVRLKIQGMTHQTGDLLALLPGWGPPPRPVIAVVRFRVPAQIKDPQVKYPAPPIRHYRVDEVKAER